MATNGNNNNNGYMQFTSSPNLGNGIAGQIQSRAIKGGFNNMFFGQEGYLDSSVKNLEAMLTKYNEMAKVTDKMQKSSKTASNNIMSELKMALAYAKEVQDTREITDKEAISMTKEIGALQIKAQKQLIRLMEEATDKQVEGAEEYVNQIEQARTKFANIKEDVAKTNTELNTIAGKLGQATENWATSIGNTLDKAGGKLRELTNMFNLQAIANNSLEQNARSKASIMSSVNKQFGFTSDRQFERFKDSLNDTVKDMNKEMNGLFNSSDMKAYMANLSKYGVTSTKMAEQQMKSSIIAQKYLGASDETQTAIFKYMKRTNNNEVLNEHNQMIVGLLNAQLGVSKEQLDVLSQQTYNDMDALAALGLDEAGVKKYKEESMGAKATMTSINEGWGSMLGNIFNEMISMPYDEMIEKYGKIFGGQGAQDIYKQLIQGNAKNAAQLIISNDYARDTLGGMSAEERSVTLKELGIDTGLFNMLNYFKDGGKQSEFINKMEGAIDEIRKTGKSDVDKYVQETTEITVLESILNKLDTWFNGIDWKGTMTMANIAFGAILAGNVIKGIGSIIDIVGTLKGVGGLKGAFTAFLGKGSAVATGASGAAASGAALSSGLVAVGGGLLLSGAAIAAINAVVQNANKSSEEHGDYSAKTQLKGTKYENNATANSLVASSNTIADRGGLQNDWNNMTSGIGYAFSKLFQGKADKNKNLTQWLMSSNTFGSDPSTLQRNIAVWGLMMDKAGYFDSFIKGMKEAGANDWSNATAKELAGILLDAGMTDALLNNIASEIINAGWKPYLSNGKRMTSANLSLDGYKMNGIDWVPKDNYRALLHKGEMVLTAKEADALRAYMGGSSNLKSSTPNSQRDIKIYPYRITSGWHEARTRKDGSKYYHSGVDFGIPGGTPIGASNPGKVLSAKYTGSYGNLVRIKDSSGVISYYAHMKYAPSVKAGQTVGIGDLLGYVGSTGNSTGNHLHYEIRPASDSYANNMNPLPYVTEGLFRAGTGSYGVTGAVTSSSSSGSSSEASGNNITVKSKKFIPKAFQSQGQGGPEDGATRITNSLDGNINKLIHYLDSIRDEQASQRELLNAFSMSRNSSSNFSN